MVFKTKETKFKKMIKILVTVSIYFTIENKRSLTFKCNKITDTYSDLHLLEIYLNEISTCDLSR